MEHHPKCDGTGERLPACPKCGEAATYQTPDGTWWDGNAHYWRVEDEGPTENAFDDTEIIHILPQADLKEHSDGRAESCACQPRIETFENGNKLIVHNAWDGREFFEHEAEQRLKRTWNNERS